MHSDDVNLGVDILEAWSRWLPSGAAVLDLGGGCRGPRSEVLFRRRFAVHAVEPDPVAAEAYRRLHPAARVACEPLEASSFFGQKFHGTVAWGLIFLMPSDQQLALLERAASALRPRGHLLFTVPSEAGTGRDRATGRTGRSLGERAYFRGLREVGMNVFANYLDEADITYYAAIKA